jgi:hypothetical protein
MDTLILACSAKKMKDANPNGVYPAALYYDGPLFKVVRKYLPGCHFLVISAKYGLIGGTQTITPYDQKLNPPSLAMDVDSVAYLADLADKLRFTSSGNIYFAGGRIYYDWLLLAAEYAKCPATFHRLPENPRGIGDIQKALVEWCKTRRTWMRWHDTIRETKR